MDSIALSLKRLKEKSVQEKADAKAFVSENPLSRTKREIRQQISKAWEYRISILQNVSSFVNVGMSQVFLVSAAQSLEEEAFKKGDVIIRQEDIGDSFYILEQGLVSVRKNVPSSTSRDIMENSRELGKLGKDAYFGDAALITGVVEALLLPTA
jgi:CRP-like cAMP-binding protein